MASTEISAVKLLIGLGIIGKKLERGERPLPDIREALLRQGFTANEISLIFDAVRNGRILGLRVNVRKTTPTYYWSLADVTVKA